MFEVFVLVGSLFLVERAYTAYKAGKKLTSIADVAILLKNDVTNIETKLNTGVAVANEDLKSFVASAKSILTSIGL